ncbi:MAG: Sec-independent protein translocase protein TatB [Pseudomonadota bacterium]|jgi:sec-independent protein translocase protein TatB|nr:Sec-independent protein translocase protein TatB [Pseudomonadota bacterium]|tara:strand:+ start:2688 stop:3056 length:369 start_codon:yes stop_codon:yes gene_type:complete
MLDLGWPELFIIMLVALLIVGPKELPGLVRTAASWLRKTKRSINNFQNSIEEIAREVELENVKKDTEELLINEVSSLPNDVGELLKVEDDQGIPNLPKTQERKPKSAREIDTSKNSKEKSDA